jgi:hypothetical protein
MSKPHENGCERLAICETEKYDMTHPIQDQPVVSNTRSISVTLAIQFIIPNVIEEDTDGGNTTLLILQNRYIQT